MKFDLSSLPKDVEFIAADIQGLLDANSAGSGWTVTAAPVSRSWTTGATWNTYDGVNPWTTPGGDAGAVTSTVTKPATEPLLRSNVTKLVPGWIANPSTNRGVLLRLSPEASAGTVLDVVRTAGSPYLTVNYLPRVGARPFYTYDSQALTDRTTVAVNVANGNLRMNSVELDLAGIGGNLTLTRGYDSRADDRIFASPMPGGWTMSPGKDLRLLTYYDGQVLMGPDGQRAWYAKKNPNSSTTGYTTPPGMNADLALADSSYPSGYLALRERKTGLKYIFGYYGLLDAIEDRNGNKTTFAYTSPLNYDSQVSSITDTRGRVITFGYHRGHGRLTSIEDNVGRSWTYGYDSTGSYLTSSTDAVGLTTTYGYDNAGLLSQICDSRGQTTNLTYDSRGRVTTLTRVQNNTTQTGPTDTFTYTDTAVSYNDSTGTGHAYPGKTVQTDPNGHDTTYYWDKTGRVARTVDALGRTRSRTYTSNSDVATATDAVGTGTSAGNVFTSSYDSDSRQMGTEAPTGALTALTYAETVGAVTNPVAHWQPNTSTDADGNQTTLSYDTAGNTTKTQDTTGGTAGAAVTYGIYGNSGVAWCGGRSGQTGQVCTATDGNNHTTGYSYNNLGELIAINHPAPRGDETMGYDGLSRLVWKIDGNGKTTRYGYSSMDRLTETRYDNTSTCTSSDQAAGTCIKYGYTRNGDLESLLDQTGTTSYTIDNLNRETSRTLPSTGTTSLTYDAAGNVLTATDANGTISYTYDDANQLTTLREPGGSCTATPKDRCTTFGYDNNGFRTTTTYPTGSTATIMTSTPDDSGRVQRITAKTGTATTHSDFTFTYTRMVGATATDGALVRTRTEMPASTTAKRTTTYGYDTLSRLTSAVEVNNSNTQTAAWTYAYDAAGNRTSATLSPAGTGGTTAFTYNDDNRIESRAGSTAGWAFDGNGAETAAVGAKTRTAATWNLKQQNTSNTVGGTANARTYTGAGNKTRLTAGSTAYRNTALGLTAETTGGSTSSFIREPNGTLVAVRTGNTSHYYTYDALGSVVGLISPTGTKANSYSYDPYGQNRASSGTVVNPFRYTGGYLDTATGLTKLGIRYYDPTLGRFTQPDPTGQDPHYTYARNNPCTYTDRNGASSEFEDNGYQLNYVEIGKSCSGGAAIGVAASIVTAGVLSLPAAIAGCIEGSLIEAAAQTVPLSELADIIRLGGGIKDIGSIFGLL